MLARNADKFAKAIEVLIFKSPASLHLNLEGSLRTDPRISTLAGETGTHRRTVPSRSRIRLCRS